MKCTNCGKEFEGKFCPECATPADPSVSQSAAQVPAENVCPKCGTRYVGNFCPKGCNSPAVSANKKKKHGCLIPILIVFGVLLLIFIIGLVSGGSDASPDAPTSGTQTNMQQADTEKAKKEEKAQSILSDAQAKFEKADYAGMIEKCDKILTDYPDTDIAKQVPAFIQEQIDSLPKVSAPDFFKEYADNEVKADTMYKDKLLVITGTVDSIGRDIMDEVYVTLETEEEFAILHPQCYFKDEDEIAKVAELAEGAQVTILAKGSGTAIGQPILKQCYIIE